MMRSPCIARTGHSRSTNALQPLAHYWLIEATNTAGARFVYAAYATRGIGLAVIARLRREHPLLAFRLSKFVRAAT